MSELSKEAKAWDQGFNAAVSFMRDADAAEATGLGVIIQKPKNPFTGEVPEVREPQYALYNGWLVEVVDYCTCYGGGPYGHEPGCGAEPLANLTDILAAHDAEIAAKALEEAASQHLRESIKDGVGNPSAVSTWLTHLAAEKRGA